MSKKGFLMRILILNWRDIRHPEKGGAEILTFEIAKRLVTKGHSVTWFSPRFKNSKPEEEIEGVQFVRAGGKYTVYFVAAWKYWHNQLGSFDIVIDEMNGIPFFSPLYIREKKILMLHHVVGKIWHVEFPFPFSSFGALFEKAALKLYAQIPVITEGKSTCRDLIRMGFQDTSTMTVGTGITRPKKPLPKKNNQLVFVGRMKKAKQPDHAIRAIGLLKNRFPDLQLKLIGGGDEKYIEEMKQQVKDLGLEKQISFLGHLGFEERNRIVSESMAIL